MPSAGYTIRAERGAWALCPACVEKLDDHLRWLLDLVDCQPATLTPCASCGLPVGLKRNVTMSIPGRARLYDVA